MNNAGVYSGVKAGVCELLRREFMLRNLRMVHSAGDSQSAISHANKENLSRNFDELVRKLVVPFVLGTDYCTNNCISL